MPGSLRRRRKTSPSTDAHPLTDSRGRSPDPTSTPPHQHLGHPFALDTQPGPGPTSLSPWGQAAADQVETPLPAGLSEEQLTAAQNWARAGDGPSTNIIQQLQAHLGVAVTGRYDRNTVIAVYTHQQSSGGIADATYMASLGLLFTRQVVDGEVSDALAENLQANHPDGYAVAFYVHYDDQSNNNREFERQATPYAARTAALGLQGASVAQGVATPIGETAEIVEGLQSIHQGVKSTWIDGLDPFVSQIARQVQSLGGPIGGPDWSKANDVALFCHGMPGGLGTDASGSYREGLHGDTYGESNIESFVNGVRGATTSDVNVQLFSCGAGRGTDERESWLENRQNHRMGQESVAQELSTHLGEEASVFAHTTTGHTTENYAARVFGAEAGGGQGGLHMFDRLFPESFIQSELLRLHPELEPSQRANRHNRLRDQMWRHYRNSIGPTIPDSRFGAPMGQLMFQDPDRAAELIQQEWQERNPIR